MNIIANKKYKEKAKNIVILILCVSLGATIILTQKVLKHSVLTSINLCMSSILPAVFPFMILGDFLLINLKISKKGTLSKVFSKMFSMSSSCVAPFLVGCICGFPTGAYIATKLYNTGAINKDEYNKIFPMSVSPSLAFIISGVGAGMRGSLRDGLILYIVIIIAKIVGGIIIKSNSSASYYDQVYKKSEFNLVISIKNSLNSAINIFAYILFFTMIVEVITYLGVPKGITLIISIVSEIGTGSSAIASHKSIFSLPITAFCLGFSGISMFLQSLSFAHSDMQPKRYLLFKTTEGAIAFALVLIIEMIL